MRRKLVKHGPSTLIVSLPATWLRKHKLAKGDELDFEVQEHSLTISPPNTLRVRRINVDLAGLDRTTTIYLIRGLYRSGYDELIIKFDKTAFHARKGIKVETAEVIRREINNLIGMEIIHEKENRIHAKEVTTTNNEDFNQLFKRVFTILLDGFKEYVGAQTDTDKLPLVEHTHDNLTRFTSYCLRILSKKDSIEMDNKQNLTHILLVIDKIMDLLKYSARNQRDDQWNFSLEIVNLLKDIEKAAESVYKTYRTSSYDTASKFELLRSQCKRDIYLAAGNVESREMLVLSRMESILELLLDINVSLVTIYSKESSQGVK